MQYYDMKEHLKLRIVTESHQNLMSGSQDIEQKQNSYRKPEAGVSYRKPEARTLL